MSHVKFVVASIEAILVTVEAKVHVEGRCLEISIVVYRCILVLAVDQHARSELDILASSVILQEGIISIETGVNVGKLDLPERVTLIDVELLPLWGELLAAAAVRIDKGNDPDVLVIGQDPLFERGSV